LPRNLKPGSTEPSKWPPSFWEDFWFDDVLQSYLSMWRKTKFQYNICLILYSWNNAISQGIELAQSSYQTSKKRLSFDSVSWTFLLEVLRRLGFGSGWCKLQSSLLNLINFLHLSIVNGEPGKDIDNRCSFWQGGLISPMLFVLVMDVLKLLVNRADVNGVLRPLAAHVWNIGSMLMTRCCFSDT
jgi:hypothetical protein